MADSEEGMIYSDRQKFTTDATVEDWMAAPRVDKDPVLEQRQEESEMIAEHTDPKHYTEGRKYETWDVILDWELGFLEGSALKYISRAGRKGLGNTELTDLIKAKNFLQKKIDFLEEKL